MLNERKLTERELDKREEAIKGLLSNKRKLVQKYGKDAEKVMYGIATKQAKKKVENMNLDSLKELIKKSLQKEAGTSTIDTGFSGRADYGEEDKALGREDELEMRGLEEGHGLSQKDIDILKNGFNAFFIAAPKYGEMEEFRRVIKFLLKSNILQDKTKDLSVKEEKEMSSDEIIKIIKMMNPEAKEKFLKKIAKMGKGKVDENLIKEFLQGALKDRNEVLFNKLVPSSGASEFAEGEMIRALNRLIYRFYNDGDKFFEGYGTETAGPAHSFLVNSDQINRGEQRKFEALFDSVVDTYDDKKYEDMLLKVADLVMSYVEGIPEDQYQELGREMFDFEPEYEDEEEDDFYDEYDEEEEEEDYYMNEGHMMPMEDLDVGHVDNEPHMLKKELARAGQMIQMLYRAVDKYDDQGEVDFPQWWQKKIIQANAMLDSAFDYIDGEEMVAKIDAMIGSMDAVEVDIDVVNEEDEVKKRLAVDKAVKSTLKDEGGAAGLDPLAKAVKKLGVSKDELKSMIKKIVGVAKHKHGDYISTPINEVMDGGRLFDYFNKEYIVDDHFLSDDSYIVKREPSGKDQYVIFDYDKDKDQFQIRQMGGYRIDRSEAIKAGMRETSSLARAGMDAYMVDGNYSPTPISIKGLKDVVDHVMGGLSREAAAQQDYYARRGPTSGTIDEKELSKSDEKKFKKIEKELNKASKMHKSQADRIGKIVKEKLTKKSKVDDFVDDFKKSDAKQFKGKSAEKKRKMAVAAYLAKQNDK